MESLFIEDHEYKAGTINFSGINIMLIYGSKGALGCAYLNLAAANKFGHALAIVRGVNCYEDMLDAEVIAVSDAAENAGVEIGMSGKKVLEIFR